MASLWKWNQSRLAVKSPPCEYPPLVRPREALTVVQLQEEGKDHCLGLESTSGSILADALCVFSSPLS